MGCSSVLLDLACSFVQQNAGINVIHFELFSSATLAARPAVVLACSLIALPASSSTRKKW